VPRLYASNGHESLNNVLERPAHLSVITTPGCENARPLRDLAQIGRALKRADSCDHLAASRPGDRQRVEPRLIGYTFGMKTAVSIPDEIFEKVERLARRAGRSRSEVFAAALAEYVARHAPDEVTDAMDRVIADVGDLPDTFVAAAGRRVLEQTEW
jgi:predicted transcriptional regulator